MQQMRGKWRLRELVTRNLWSLVLAFFIFFAAGSVVSLGASLLVYSVNYNSERTVLLQREKEILSINSIFINEHLQQLEDDVTYLATLKRTRDFVESGYSTTYTPGVLYRSFLKRKEGYREILIRDASGKAVLKTIGTSTGDESVETLSMVPFFKNLMRRKSFGVYFSPFMYSASKASPGLFIGKVIADREGNRKAGLVAVYESSPLFRLLHKSMYFSQGFFFFTNPQGTVLPVDETEDPEMGALRKVITSPGWLQSKNRTEGYVQTEEGIVSFARVHLSRNESAIGWKLLSFITRRKLDTYFSPVRRERNVLLIIFLFFSVVLSLVFSVLRVRKRVVQNELLLLHAAFDQSANAIVITDLEGTIAFGNSAFEKITGYTLKELVGNNPRVLKSTYHGRDFYRSLWETIRSGKVWRGVFLNKRKDGTPFWERATISPVKNDKNSVIYYMAVKEDISEIRERENELKRERELLELATIDAENSRKEAERANKLKSIFLANISHEIRTPMNAVLGFTRILLEDETDGIKEDYLKTILDSGEHLLMLINDILDFSKIESGKMELVLVKLRIRDVVASVVTLMEQKAAEKKLQVTVRAENVPDVLIGDEKRIRQILINLVGNAVKFTEKGGIDIAASWDGETVHIAVTDTGIGIPPKEQDRIFKPFEQENTAALKKYGGTGLGLAISKRYAEHMGGTLSVSSTPGEGSCFTLSLPLQTSAGRSDLQSSQGEDAIEELESVEEPRNRQQEGYTVSPEVLEELSLSVEIFNRKRLLSIADAMEADRTHAASKTVAVQLRDIARSFDAEALRQLVEKLR